MGSEGRRQRVLLAASNYPSAFFDREAYLARDDMEHPIPSWLSLQLFGDAAAAVLLEATDDPDQAFCSRSGGGCPMSSCAIAAAAQSTRQTAVSRGGTHTSSTVV